MNNSQCSWGNKTNHENQSREKLQNQNKKNHLKQLIIPSAPIGKTSLCERSQKQ